MRPGPLWFISALLVCAPLAHAQTSAPAKATVEGDVINVTTGAPIAGAQVRLDNEQSDPLFTKADERGHFRFDDVELGVHFLTARSPGFMTSMGMPLGLRVPRGRQRAEILRGGPSATPAAPPSTVTTGTDGAPHFTMTVPLVAYAVISGKVNDPYGAPMPDCNIQLLEKSPDPPGSSPPSSARQNEFHTKAQSRTNDKGEFRIANLEPGTYFLAVSDPGRMTAWENTYRTTYYPAAVALAGAKPLVLAAGQRLRTEFKIVQQAGVQVAGRVIKPQGAEYAEAKILTSIVLVAEPADTPGAQGPVIMVEDDYRIRDVLPGKYTLFAVSQKATTDPFGGEPKQILGFARHLEVGGQDVEGADLTLVPFRELTGQVMFEPGCNPVPVRVTPYSSGPFGPAPIAAVVDGEGKFVLRGLTAGRYRFTVDPQASKWQNLPIKSITQGERDIMQDGFESPFAGDEPLRITLGCAAAGRAQ